MTVTVYRSTDASAPTMSKSVGQWITILDAILVNGYGAKSAAGWTKSYSGTNKAVYRAGGGSQSYLRIDDSGQANYATDVAGSAGASDVDTITGRFPLVGTTLVWDKSANARWICVANDKAFYFFVGADPGWNTSATFNHDTAFHGLFFGDIAALGGTSDTGRALLGASAGSLNSSSSTGNLAGAPAGVEVLAQASAYSLPSTQAYMAMDGALKTAAPRVRLEVPGIVTNTSIFHAQTSAQFGQDFRRLEVMSFVGGRSDQVETRGFMPGLYLPKNLTAFTGKLGQTWSGAGASAGKTFEMIPTISVNVSASHWSAANLMPLIVETSDTWDN